MQWDIGAEQGEALIDLDDFRRIGILQRHDVSVKTDRVEQFAMLLGTCEHRSDRIMRIEFVLDRRIDRTAVDADSNRAVVGRRSLDDELDFILPSLRLLVMVQVPWVVADLVDVRGDLGDESVVLLKVDREVGGGLFSDFGKGGGVFVAIDGDTDDIRAGMVQVVDQSDGRRDIGRVRGSHALDCDRVSCADRDRADADASCGVSLDLHGDSFGGFRWLAIVYRRRPDPPTAGCFAW